MLKIYQSSVSELLNWNCQTAFFNTMNYNTLNLKYHLK
jgi:hypothetical protein